jgi:hypothetical protein
VWYAPQNRGNAEATINAQTSAFTGSLSLILGEAVTGGGLTPSNGRIVGIKYKAFSRFMFDTITSNIGGNPDVGSPAVEVVELFNSTNPSGVTAAVPFNQEFTWRGIKFKVSTPAVGYIPLVLPSNNDPEGDFFTWHAVVATTSLLDPDGQPCACLPSGIISGAAANGDVIMHERMLSRFGIRLIPVLDGRVDEGGFGVSPYI